MLDCLRMLHYHQGSQIPSIRAIRNAAVEAARVLFGTSCRKAQKWAFWIWAAVSPSATTVCKVSSPSSSDYGTKEYCADVIEAISEIDR